MTQESIIASLEHTTGAQAGEHVLCTDQLLQDAERENTISCNTSDNIAHDHKIIPPNETTDSGIMLSSGQNSSNYQDTNVSPISAFTGGLVEHSSSSSSSDLSEHAAQLQGMHDELQEHNEQALLQTTLSGADVISSSLNSVTHTSAVSDNVTEPTKAKCTTLNESHDHTEYCQALVHPSGTNTAFNSQTVGWTLFNSSHATESQGQMTTVSFGTLEPLPGAGGYVHEHAQNSVVISSGSISPELDKMNGLLSISSESLSCFLHVDTTLTLDDITNDDLNANADSTGCNISTNNYCITRLEVPSESIRSDSTVEQYYHEQQVPMYTIDQAENSLYQAHGGRSTAGITNNLALVHVTGMDGSSLSLMCDTEY